MSEVLTPAAVTPPTPAARAVTASRAWRPPAPIPHHRTLSLVQLLKTLKRNPLECWSAEHFSEPIAKVQLPIGQVLLVHEPSAIRHILLDNAENYRKDPLQRRVPSARLRARP